MIRQLKNWVFNKSIKERPKTSSKEGVNNGNTILLFGSYDDFKEISAFADFFRKNGKNVKLLMFSKMPVDDGNVYTAKEMNWAGIPKSSVLDKRFSEQFDICIFFDTAYSPHYKYVMSNLKSEFSIGPKFNELEEYFDLIIETKDGDIKSFFEQVKINLKLLSR